MHRVCLRSRNLAKPRGSSLIKTERAPPPTTPGRRILAASDVTETSLGSLARKGLGKREAGEAED